MHAEYAKGIEALCRKKGILFLVDEVQGGLFRREGAIGRYFRFVRQVGNQCRIRFHSA